MSDSKVFMVTVEWPIERFECLSGCLADLSDWLVTISEEPTMITAQKHTINGDDVHKMFEAHIHFNLNKLATERIANIKAFFDLYMKDNIGVTVNYR
jgi:hypothetical protein